MLIENKPEFVAVAHRRLQNDAQLSVEEAA